MPKRLFHELNKEKRAKICEVALREFAHHAYRESSTNRIVEKAGISKGSLFKYFENKEDIYFYLLDDVIAELLRHMEGKIQQLPQDLFERIIAYAELEFDYYIRNQDKYKLIKRAFEKNDMAIYRATMAKYASMGDETYYRLFEDVDAGALRWDKRKILDIMKWFLKGLNGAFMDDLDAKKDMKGAKEAYVAQLEDYMTMLKAGLAYKEDSDVLQSNQ